VRACLVAAVVVVVAATAAPASASPGPSFVLWTGGVGPGSTAYGVILNADGTGQQLATSDGKTVKATGVFAPKGKKLAAIRAAAHAALTAPTITAPTAMQDGGYASVQVVDGSTSHAAIEVNAKSPKIEALIAAVNAALPAIRKLPTSRVLSRLRIDSPSTADCPTNDATTITKQISMQDAAAAHIVTLTPKGNFFGDSVKVSATWKPIKAPITVTLHLEMIPPPGSTDDWVDLMNQVANARLKPVTIKSGAEAGTTVSFKLDVRTRGASDPPTPCYHEILLTDTSGFRSFVDDTSTGAPRGGVWATDDPGAFAHEMGHLMGLDDHYTDYFLTSSGVKIPLPQNGLEGDALQAALPHGISKDAGRVASTPWYPNDIMSIASKGFTDAELRFMSRNASLDIHDDPGDVLVNKDSGAQDLLTAHPFDLLVPPHGTATVNGLTAYCINEHLHIPDSAGGFDVLGPIGAQPGATAAALQRVANTVGAEVASTGSFAAVDAFWRVSDNASTSDPDALKLLADAGVSATDTYAPAPFENPNAGSPQTAGITATGLLPEPDVVTQGPVAPPPSIASLSVSPSRARLRHGRATVTVTTTLAGGDGPVTVAVVRGATSTGHALVTLRAQPFVEGLNAIAVPLRHARRGTYTVTATLTGGHPVTARLRLR